MRQSARRHGAPLKTSPTSYECVKPARWRPLSRRPLKPCSCGAVSLDEPRWASNGVSSWTCAARRSTASGPEASMCSQGWSTWAAVRAGRDPDHKELAILLKHGAWAWLVGNEASGGAQCGARCARNGRRRGFAGRRAANKSRRWTLAVVQTFAPSAAGEFMPIQIAKPGLREARRGQAALINNASLRLF